MVEYFISQEAEVIMRPHLTLFVLAFFLSACSHPISQPSTSTPIPPTVTVLSTVTPTFTETVTDTPTLTETTTATATQTPKFSQDLSHPENLPEITLEEITSTDFAQKFLDAAQAGELPKAPPTAKPAAIDLSYVSASDLQMEKKYGGGNMFLFDHQKALATNDNLFDLSERPNYVAAAYQVAFQGETAYAVIMGYVNKSGPDGYFGFLFKPEHSTDVAEELAKFFPGNDQTRTTTGTFLDNEKSVKAFFGYYGQNPDSAFGAWYLSTLANNPNLVFPKPLLESWHSSGDLVNTLNGKPFIPFTLTSSMPVPLVN